MSKSPPAHAVRGAAILRVIGILAAAGLVVLMVAWLGERWWVARYLQSERFRKLLSQHTAAALHVEGEFLPLHWAGNSVYADGFYGRGLPESPLREIRLDQIRAVIDPAGLFWRTWRVRDLEMQRVQATLQSWERPSGRERSGGSPESRPEGRSHNLGPIRINELNLTWPMGANASGSVRRAQVVVELADAGWQASGSGGELTVRDWRLIKLGSFRLRSQGDTLFITESRLDLIDGGHLVVSGEVRTGAARDVDLVVRYADVPVTNWLPADWRGRLAGQAGGQSTVRGPAEALRVDGTIALTDARLEALPVLDQIAVFTRTEQFRRVSLSKASAEFGWEPQRLTVRRLQLESPGLLRVEGGCVVEQGTVAGEFEVGVAASTLRWLPGARTRVFTVERDGYQWTTVRVQGPLNRLQEDLSGRLVAAAGKEVIEGATGVIESGAQEFFDLLRKITP